MDTLDVKLLRGFFMLVVGYFKYSFFGMMVLLTLLPVILIISVLGFDLSFEQDVIPDFQLDEKGIVKFFAVLVFIYWGLERLVLYLLKKYFHKEFKISIKRRALVMFAFATATYLGSFVVFIVGSWMLPFYIGFGLFYLFDLFCIGMYFAFEKVQDWLSKVEFKSS